MNSPLPSLSALLVVTREGAKFKREIKELPYTIGRSNENALTLEDDRASRRHAEITCGELGWRIEDKKSTAGTLLNGEKVINAPLRHGDKIRIGSHLILFAFDLSTFERQPLGIKLALRMVELKASDAVLRHGQPPRLMVRRAYHTCPGLEAPLTDSDIAGVIATLTGGKVDPSKGHTTAVADTLLNERFRLHAYAQQGHTSLIIRHIRSRVPVLADLNLPEAATRLAQLRSGLVILGGAPNSGKTTTIAALLETINRERQARIVTLEDPVEFRFTEKLAVIDQIEVGTDVPTFEEARRSLVRQNPEVVFIGELRDAETLDTALQSAAAGQLVFATLHTVNASQVIPRVLQLSGEKDAERRLRNLSAHLKAIFCQKLLPAADKSHPVVVAAEYIFIDPGSRALVERGDDASLADYLRGRPEIAQDFNRGLQILMEEGKISRETAVEHSPNPEQLHMNLMGIELNEDNKIIRGREKS
ncbi:MAG: ATPase, T2SS/T4P/T4SS family [Planctomycetota bacterium]